MSFVVAIDGPAGTGKGTITKILSRKTGLINIDTGAMYRCVALECINNNVSISDKESIEKILNEIDIKLINDKGYQKVLLNGKNVSNDIRKPNIDDCVAEFAALKIVRDKITPMQQKMAEDNDVIMEGRDIATVVFPNADVKIFLDCSLEERARRRYNQNLKKGINESYEDVLNGIIKRHKLETERKIAPLIKADDAILVDSTNLAIDEVVDIIENIIRKKKNCICD